MENEEKLMEAISKKMSEGNADLIKQLNAVQKNFDELETKYKKMSITDKFEGNPLIKELNNEILQKQIGLKKENVGTLNYSFTIPNTIFKGDVLQPTSFGQVGSYYNTTELPFRESGVAATPKRYLRLWDIIQWGTSNSPTISWVEVSGGTNSAAGRAEGSTMAQSDIQFLSRSVNAVSFSHYMKATIESLNDVDYLAGEINADLIDNLMLKIEDKILSGATNSTTDIKGIIPYATAWSVGTWSGYTAPNKGNAADVIRVAIDKIHVAGNGRFIPNYCLVHPTLLAELDLLHVSDGRYIDIPYLTYATSVDGKPSVLDVKLIPTTMVDTNSALVGDFNKAKAFIVDNPSVRFFDQNDTDPINNLATITANARIAFRIKNPDASAFLYISDVSEAVDDLNGAN